MLKEAYRKVNINGMSKNIYQLPFHGKVDVRPAPFHFESSSLRNAVDFALNVGEPILAAGDGLVYKIVDRFGKGRFDKAFLDRCNFVVIQHKNREYSAYVHLRKGILVREQQRVLSGQPIGYSGLSGYTSYSHLHFEIMTQAQSNNETQWKSIPARFRVNGNIQTLVSPKD